MKLNIFAQHEGSNYLFTYSVTVVNYLLNYGSYIHIWLIIFLTFSGIIGSGHFYRFGMTLISALIGQCDLLQ